MRKVFNKLFIIFIIMMISIVSFVVPVMATEETGETPEVVENKTPPSPPAQNTTPPKNTTPEEPAVENKTTNTNTTKTNTVSENTTRPTNVNKSSDCFLKSLKVGEGTLSPVFTKECISYKVKFPSNYDFSTLKEIKIEAQANDSKATVTGTGVRSVNGEGITNLAVTVKAENGQEKIYTITIEKPKNLSMSDLKLSSLNVDKKNSNGILSRLEFTPSFNENTVEYTADVGSDVTSVVVYAKAVSGIEVDIEGASEDGTYDLVGGTNTIYITLTSEKDDTLVTNYKLTINKPETGEDGVTESEASIEKKEFKIMPIVIGVIAVLAFVLIVLMIINHKQKKENGEYDDDEDYEEDTEEEKNVKTKKKKSKDNGKRFAK